VLFAFETGWAIIPVTVVLILLSVFMILLVLIQRGKGGGLAGAFGGAGGSSAFGSRAGDTFTKVTIYTALVWLFLVMILIKIVPQHPSETRAGDVAPAPVPMDDQTP
jgi:preprotein translocase subunit SecG